MAMRCHPIAPRVSQLLLSTSAWSCLLGSQQEMLTTSVLQSWGRLIAPSTPPRAQTLKMTSANDSSMRALDQKLRAPMLFAGISVMAKVATNAPAPAR